MIYRLRATAFCLLALLLTTPALTAKSSSAYRAEPEVSFWTGAGGPQQGPQQKQAPQPQQGPQPQSHQQPPQGAQPGQVPPPRQLPQGLPAGLNFIEKVTSGTLFENVSAVLLKRYYDQGFRSSTLPGLIQQYSDKAKSAGTLAEQRNVVQEFLSKIPTSHLGLLSMESHKLIVNDLFGRPYPTFGFQLIELNGENYAYSILEGGPAQTAGLLPWDRIVSIDGIATARSPRVDWRTDDASIPDDRDPPVHYLIAKAGEAVRLKIERRKGEFRELSIPATDYSALAAARASARVIMRGGHSIGYFHFWYVHITGVPELLKEKIETDFKDCQALVIDLRGRGGNGAAISRIIEILKQDKENRQRPIVALIDRGARSAKDVLAYELKKNGIARLVGERTAGAVIPATFADVGYDSVLMFPSFKMPKYTDLLESKGVDPDLFIERGMPFGGGADPILEGGVNEAARLAGLPREPRPATTRLIVPLWDRVAGTTRAAIAF